MSKISEINQTLQASARANKYRVSFTFPAAVGGVTPLREIYILAKEATAPGKEIGVIELLNQGRKLIIPGDTTFDNNWPVTFYLGENHALRIDMLKWLNACDNFHKNRHSGKPSEIFVDLIVEQLDSAEKATAVYTIHGSFPTNVGDVSYGDDSENTVGEFEVNFAYTDWVIGKGEEDDYSLISPTLNPTAL